GENVPLFDEMLAGLSLTTTAGYGPVGTCVTQAAGSTAPGLGQEGCGANQVMQHGSAHLRRSATLQANLANGNLENVANSLLNLATSGTTGQSCGFVNLPIDPSTGQAITGVQQRLVRNGCDRIANNLYNPAQPAGPSNIKTRCFPENYLTANPQFNQEGG